MGNRDGNEDDNKGSEFFPMECFFKEEKRSKIDQKRHEREKKNGIGDAREFEAEIIYDPRDSGKKISQKQQQEGAER